MCTGSISVLTICRRSDHFDGLRPGGWCHKVCALGECVAADHQRVRLALFHVPVVHHHLQVQGEFTWRHLHLVPLAGCEYSGLSRRAGRSATRKREKHVVSSRGRGRGETLFMKPRGLLADAEWAIKCMKETCKLKKNNRGNEMRRLNDEDAYPILLVSHGMMRLLSFLCLYQGKSSLKTKHKKEPKAGFSDHHY